MPPDVPACQEADNGSARERQYGVQRGKGPDRKGLAFFWSFAETPLRRANLPYRSNLTNWTEKSRQSGDVIRTEIQDGTGTLLIEHNRIGMPMLHSLGHDRCQTGDDRTDTPLIDQSFGALQAGPENRIRRTTYTQTLRLSLLHQRNTVLKGGRQGLLTINVFSSGDRGSVHF